MLLLTSNMPKNRQEQVDAIPGSIPPSALFCKVFDPEFYAYISHFKTRCFAKISGKEDNFFLELSNYPLSYFVSI